jgi:DNA adenine methylase
VRGAGSANGDREVSASAQALFTPDEMGGGPTGPARLDPLLKWPGGKRKLLSSILPLAPGSHRCYYEPFVGGGAVFFALCPARAVLADSNEELINCYIQVRDRHGEVTEYLRAMPNSERLYYETRASAPTDPVARAARLIYLTTLSFNGIYRENLAGVFNVPYGRKTHLDPCDPARIAAISAALMRATLMCVDFERAVFDAGRHDIVYLDPPYTVAHGDNGFLKYNSRIFSWEDQKRLAAVARRLADRGCRVIVSNADHPSILDLYRGFRVLRVQRSSVIAADGESRRLITECVFHREG